MLEQSDFSVRRSRYRENLTTFLRSQNSLHLLTEMQGNIGDHLIWQGTAHLLGSERLSYKSVCVAETQENESSSASLVIPGSGAFSKLWHEWLPEVVNLASRNYRAVIVLPSGFDADVPVVAQCLSRTNVFAFAREVRSYQSIKAFGRAALSFDCALYHDRFQEEMNRNAAPVDDGVALLALREDQGSLLSLHDLAPNPSLNDDISLSKTDLDAWFDAIAQSDSIVTDRLHVAITGLLLGKRVKFCDPYDDKLSTYFSFTFRDAFADRLTKCGVEWLLANKFIVRRGTA